MNRFLSLVLSPGARDTYILTLGNLADSFFAFLFTLVSFRLLSGSEFGLFSAFNNLIYSTSLILDFGLSQALLYYLPHQKDRDAGITIGTAISLRLLIASVFALLLFTLSPQLSAQFFPGSTTSLFYVSSLAIIFTSLIDILFYSLQGLRKFALSIIVSNTYSVLRLFAVIVFAKYAFAYSAYHALLISVYSPIFGILLGLYLLKPQKPTFKLAKKLLGFGGFMGLYRICQIVALRSDVQIVLTALGATIAGTYSVAARMGNFYPLIIITLNSLFASRLRLLTRLTPNFMKKSLLLTFAILILMLICSWQAPLIIRLLFGANAKGAGILYRFLTLAYLPLMAATLPISILVFHYGVTKFVGFLGVIQVFVTLAVSFIFISRLSQFAPILGLAAANSLVFILSCYKVIRIWKLE